MKIQQFLSAVLLLSLLTTSASAEETRKNKLWKISLAVLAATSIADASTSWNRPEANPLLQGSNGRFSSRGIALKGAIVGSTMLGQYLLVRKQPSASRTAAYTNFAISGLLGGVAIYNYRLSHQSPTPAVSLNTLPKN
jgi:hypothetical protein